MRFQSISYKNYRCFKDTFIKFTSPNNDSKNITLICAKNGHGKTEILFSFHWLFLQFDFSSLIGKETTPWAINEDLYRNLLHSGAEGECETCSVKLAFRFNEEDYVLTKIGEFTKRKNKIEYEEKYLLGKTDETSNFTIFSNDKEQIKYILGNMLPPQVLKGIVIDGERMQKISSHDTKSINEVKAIIEHTTNKSAYDKWLSYLNHTRQQISKERTKLSRKNNDFERERDSERLTNIMSDLAKLKNSVSTNRDKVEKIRNELDSISEKLKDIEATKELERERIQLIATVEAGRAEQESIMTDFQGELSSEGFLLIIEGLINEIKLNIENYEAPTGLSSEAVRSILMRENCICGKCLDSESKQLLSKLIDILPPDNMNSLLLEKCTNMSNRQNRVNEAGLKRYARYEEINLDRTSKTKRIQEISSQIGRLEESSELESNKERFKSELVALLTFIAVEEDRILQLEEEYKTTNARLSNSNQVNEDYKVINRRFEFINKCINAVNLMQKKYTDEGLLEINRLLKTAYLDLSSGSEIGRDVYITKFREPKFKLITYDKRDVQNLYQQYVNNHDKNEISKEELMEMAIIESGIGNSGGQGKSVTISFVKAILDFARTFEKNSQFIKSENYPVVIDAPFGDLSDDDLRKPALKLADFSEQVILMLTPKEFDVVKKYISPRIGEFYTINKIDNKYSELIKGG